MKKIEGAPTKEVARLRERLSKYERPKNSCNSSMPPSKDGNRPKKGQTLRRPTGIKPGGQPGHKGKTLEMTDARDRTIGLRPDYCHNFGILL